MKSQVIYKRPRIDDLLSGIIEYPFTSVVAGMGYGKTTAASEYLKKANVPYAWVTLSSSDADVFWDQLCDAIEPHSAEAAHMMRVKGMPVDEWTISKMVRLVVESCQQTFILCIDDYQLINNNPSVNRLLELMVHENNPNFHILILSRTQPNIKTATFAAKGMALCIDVEELNFNIEETRGYLEMRGLRLTRKTVNVIHDISGGWISAIFLLGEGIRTGKDIRNNSGINALLEENMMDQLQDMDKEILYRLSVFDGFPMDMAVYATGMERTRKVVTGLMEENAFITCSHEGLFYFHPLLKHYLSERCPNDEVQRNIYRRAGKWYLSQLDYRTPQTVELFEKADCVEEYLSMINKPRARRMNFADTEAIYHMAMGLPDEMCIKYPFPYLQIIFFLLLSGKETNMKLAARMMETMRDHFTEEKDPYSDTILGELIVISRATGFGQIEGTSEPLEEASRLLKGRPSEILENFDPFTFGLPMLMYSEYMKAGTLDETVKRCSYNPYELVTDGFGRGSEQLIVSEAMLLRCKMDETKYYAIQALDAADEKQQYFVMACAYFVLMRRSLFLGDTEDASNQLDKIRILISTVFHTVDDERSTIIMLREIVFLAECFFNTSLGREEDIKPDILNGTYKSAMVGGLGIPQAYEARAMYMAGDHSGAGRLCEEMKYMTNICQCARLGGLIISALSRESFYGDGKGNEALVEALKEAQKDGVVLFFAENPDIQYLCEKLKGDKEIDSSFIDNICQLCTEYRKVAPKLSHARSSKNISTREKEVLKLIAEGKSRATVAEILGIQENTVKAHLASVYRKLGARGMTDAVRIARTNKLI